MINIKSKDLKLADLHIHAVWTWSADLMDSEDILIPVKITREALADADTLLIHAKFHTAGGASHEGLIVYDPDLDNVFAIELFLGDARITLNRNSKDLSNLELQRYEKLTGNNCNNVLPIQYEITTRDLPISPAEFTFTVS
ncbi:hypothetical protein [Massilia genomosp. 1]|uniref:Uncharacterized protein n=1 Tax=Massilia genomosp. 1 TaxID=2609280 RepID=A0ABX0N6L2_9BURK|nr:hypothetical protein [Massilia genomosp. 1]NHZ67129.1 hypothetical protein [Massilia genomosp. 1]